MRAMLVTAVPLVLFGLLVREPGAWAQVASPSAAEVAGQAAATQASFDTGRMLAMYMAQLAAAGTPPSQADIDQAAREYFTNGAAMTGVPSSGPAAEYYRNGAAVAAVPTSGPAARYFTNGAEVMAYPAPSAAPAGIEARPTTEEPEPPPTDAGARPVARPEPAPSTGTPAPPSSGTAAAPGGLSAAGLTCSPQELQAAMAIASGFASGALPSPPEAPPERPMTSPPSSASPPPAPSAAAPANAIPSEPAAVPSSAILECPPPSVVLPAVAFALGGGLLGSVGVGMWARPRLREARRRS